MRLWSLHPKFLYPQALNTLWRSGILARKILLGEVTKTTNYPHLDRFKGANNPIKCLDHYMYFVLQEALERGYKYDPSKITIVKEFSWRMTTTKNQLRYEWKLLWRRVKEKHPDYLLKMKKEAMTPHPFFRQIKGPVDPWEEAVKENT